MSRDQSQEKENLPIKKEMSNEHMLIAYWAAHGFDAKKIAQELKYKETTVKNILKDDHVKLLIRKVKHKIYGEDPALHIKECAAKGIEVADEIMMNRKNKPNIRLLAAQDFMNRGFGKPGIEDSMVEGTVRRILQALTSDQNQVDLNQTKAKDDIEDATYSELPVEQPKEEPKEADKVDDWIDKNIK